MQAKSFQPYSDDDFKQLFDKIDKATAEGDYQAISQYRPTLKMYWDTNSVLKTAVQDGFQQGVESGFEQGIQQEKLLTIQKATTMGLSNESIAELTGLTLEQIYQIKSN